MPRAPGQGGSRKLVCRAGILWTLPWESQAPLDSVTVPVNGTTPLTRVRYRPHGDITIIEHDPGVPQTACGILSDLFRVIQRRYAPGGTPCQNTRKQG
ncbi:MAG: hypothetical protein AB1576_14355 [Bacillota bacterium]|jgi:hypothetical protein